MARSRPSPLASTSRHPTATVHRLSQTAARGSDVNPMSDPDLEQKLKTAAAALSLDVTPLIDAIWELEASTDVSRLASLAVPKE